MLCRDCGLLTSGETEAVCTFCRSRTRFWTVCDDLPVGLRAWAVSSLRIWTSILQEEAEKFQEHKRLQEEAGKTAASKAKSPATNPSPGPGRAEAEEGTSEPDKAWVETKREEEKASSPIKKESSPTEAEEEGKHTSSSKAYPRDQKRPSRRQSRTRSRRHRDKKRASKTRSRSGRRHRRSSRGEAAGESARRDREARPAELRARPSVRPPHTPSKSPPGRHEPPSRTPPIIRPAVKRWDGKPAAWKLQPQYYGENKGAKKRERHWYRAQGDES